MTTPSNPAAAVPAAPRGAARSASPAPDAVLARRRAIVAVMGAALFYSVAAIGVKALGGALPVAEIVLFRNLFALPVLIPLVLLRGGWGAFRMRHPWGHAQRIFWGLFGMWGVFAAYGMLPIATVTALGFTMPLFLTALSVPMLGERVGPRRWAAVLVGLAGVALILQPWGGEPPDPWAVGLVLLSSLGWALAMISIRRMGERGEPGDTIVLWFALGAALVGAVASVPVWETPSAAQWGVLAMIGLVSALAQLMMTAAYRTGETTLIAPFEYSAILWSVSWGALFWGEWPDRWDLAGVAVLVASGLYIWRREAVRSGRAG